MKPPTKMLLKVSLASFAIFFVAVVLLSVGKVDHTPPKGEALAEVEVMWLIEGIKAYRDEYGAMPSGDNIAILASLRGNNLRKINFINLPEQMLDAQGHYLDPWGSPYRIDVSDPKNPKVWSLGKNKIDEHDDPKSDDICSWR
jgi:hypothetical protein